MISAAQNVLDRYDLLVIDFKYQKSIISRLAKKRRHTRTVTNWALLRRILQNSSGSTSR